jgi:hypothetical protein
MRTRPVSTTLKQRARSWPTFTQDCADGLDLGVVGQSSETQQDDARAGSALASDEFAEVLVGGDEHPRIVGRGAQHPVASTLG